MCLCAFSFACALWLEVECLECTCVWVPAACDMLLGGCACSRCVFVCITVHYVLCASDSGENGLHGLAREQRKPMYQNAQNVCVAVYPKLNMQLLMCEK